MKYKGVIVNKHFNLLSLTFGVLFIFMLTSCSTRIMQLNSIDVTGPAHRHTIRVTENRSPNDLEVRAYVSNNSDQIYKSKLDSDLDGKVQVVNTFSDNFRFHPTEFQSGIDFDFSFSSHIAFTGGLTLSEIDGISYVCQNIGFGFFSEGDNTAWRIDFNMKSQKMKYSALIKIIENDVSTDYIQSDVGDNWNSFFGFTFNSKRQDWFLNYFFNVGFGRQTFFDFEFVDPQVITIFEKPEYDYTESYTSFGAGVYKNVTENGRLVLGFRYTRYNDQKHNLLIPDLFVQYDFKLF